MSVNLELLGPEKLKRSLTLIEREVFPKANARALNRTLTKLRTRTVRSVASRMGVVQRSVRNRAKISRATPSRQIATIRLRGRAFNLISFKGTRKVKAGVSAAPWGNRRIFQTAFIATINGTNVVMRRQKRGGRLVPRMPIRAMLGPGIAKTAAEEELREERENVVRTVYPVELEKYLAYYVQRALKRR